MKNWFKGESWEMNDITLVKTDVGRIKENTEMCRNQFQHDGRSRSLIDPGSTLCALSNGAWLGRQTGLRDGDLSTFYFLSDFKLRCAPLKNRARQQLSRNSLKCKGHQSIALVSMHDLMWLRLNASVVDTIGWRSRLGWRSFLMCCFF